MNKIYFALVLILLVPVIGCDKKSDVAPELKPDPKPNLELSITPLGVLPYGAKSTITWKSENAKTCTLNNKPVELSGTLEVQIFENTSYTIVASNGTASTVVDKAVTVGDWTTSKLGLLTYKPWMLKSKKIYQDGKVIFDSLLGADEKTNVFYFSTDYTCVVVDASGKKSLPHDWKFDIDETHYLSGDQTCLIYSLTKTEFTIRYDMIFNNLPSVIEMSYYRP